MKTFKKGANQTNKKTKRGQIYFLQTENKSVTLFCDLSSAKIYLVKIKPDDPRFKYEIPNGNEAGAYPKEWVPGGETKSGTKEATLIGSEKIDHGADMNKLLSQFDDWEQPQ